jgi:hypothetical protein
MLFACRPSGDSRPRGNRAEHHRPRTAAPIDRSLAGLPGRAGSWDRGVRRLVVYGVGKSEIGLVLVADVRSGSHHFLPVGLLAPWLYQAAYAHESDLLFVATRRGIGDTFHDIDVIHADTGTVVKTLDVWPFSADQLITNASGRHSSGRRRSVPRTTSWRPARLQVCPTSSGSHSRSRDSRSMACHQVRTTCACA